MASYKKGRLKFRIHGRKLKGAWVLARKEKDDRGKESWMLFKLNDEYARPGSRIVEELPKSVSSGRTIEEIALDQARVWRFNISVAENIKAGAIAARANDALAEIKGALKAARRP